MRAFNTILLLVISNIFMTFTLVQLKVIQEVITLLVFTVFTLLLFRNEELKWNHLVGFVFLILAVYFIRK